MQWLIMQWNEGLFKHNAKTHKNKIFVGLLKENRQIQIMIKFTGMDVA
jgi:hypothetical protein